MGRDTAAPLLPARETPASAGDEGFFTKRELNEGVCGSVPFFCSFVVKGGTKAPHLRFKREKEKALRTHGLGCGLFGLPSQATQIPPLRGKGEGLGWEGYLFCFSTEFYFPLESVGQTKGRPLWGGRGLITPTPVCPRVACPSLVEERASQRPRRKRATLLRASPQCSSTRFPSRPSKTHVSFGPGGYPLRVFSMVCF